MKYLSLSVLLFSSVSVFSQKTDTILYDKIDEVTVLGNLHKYQVDSSATVSKLPLKDIENPQVYNSVSKNLMRDQVVTNLNDALKNATGITRLWESTGRGGDGAEFYSMRGFSVQPTMLNGLASISNGGLDPANIETIEVIKGPSGTLFGGNLISYGGLINVVSKKPYEKFGGEIGYVNGSNGLNRATVDINTPLSSKLFVRVNGAFTRQNSFQDAGFSQSFYVAPSLKFVANERLSFTINAEYKNSESANAPMIFLSRYSPLSFSSMDLFEKTYLNSYTSNNLTIKNPTMGLQSQMQYKLSKAWTSQTTLSRSNTVTSGYYQYLWDSANGGDFTRFISKRNGETNATNIQQNFIGDFKLGPVRNRLVVGLDYLNKQIRNSSSGWVGHGTVSLANNTDTGILTTQAVDNTLLASTEGNSNVETTVMSAYASDVVNVLPNLSAMLSLRVDHFSGRPTYYSTEEVKNQVTLSPKLGLVYQPIKDVVSVFGNYMNGFTNIDPALVSDTSGQNQTLKIFDPEHANQWEFGAKANLYHNKIALTASYYNITVSNKVMTDPTNPNNSIQGGEVVSKGFEISVVANPIAGLNLVTGFSHNSSEVTKDAPDAGYLGLRPEEAGPQNLFNFWANYKVQTGLLKNFGLGFGANYASEHKTLNRSTTGTFTLPSYTVLNAALSYGGDKFGITFKVDNLTNLKYYSGWSTVTPQRLRALSLALNYKF